jgi:L-asparaginase II
MVALADSRAFLSLDIGNENHIAVLVIMLCHNSPQMLLERCSTKYDNVMALCCSQMHACENYVVFDEAARGKR